jgi:hypothetical protein
LGGALLAWPGLLLGCSYNFICGILALLLSPHFRPLHFWWCRLAQITFDSLIPSPLGIGLGRTAPSPHKAFGRWIFDYGPNLLRLWPFTFPKFSYWLAWKVFCWHIWAILINPDNSI